MKIADFEVAETIVERLQAARKVVVFTGAGISAESGIPTFRDPLKGLWENYNAEELASQGAFKRDPAMVWGWYEWRRMMVQRAQPNPGHLAIADLYNRVDRLVVITQNVDDLHERAGSLDVLHLHGRLSKASCFSCRQPYTFPLGALTEPESGWRIEPPRCNRCGGRIRPGVVWFGEMLPDIEWDAANHAAYSCDALLCIGTSALVKPAARLPNLAIQRDAITVQINPSPTSLDGRVTLNLPGPAGVVLPALVNAIWPPRAPKGADVLTAV